MAMKRDRGAITFPTLLLVLVSLVILSLAIWTAFPLDILLVSTLAIYLGIDVAAALTKTRRPQGDTLLYAAAYPLIHFSYVAGLARDLLGEGRHPWCTRLLFHMSKKELGRRAL